MSAIVIFLIVLASIVAAVALAYLPLKVVIDVIARKIAVPIRAFIQRQRDRRVGKRETPDRRQTEY